MPVGLVQSPTKDSAGRVHDKDSGGPGWMISARFIENKTFD